MLLTEARAWVRQFAANAASGDTSAYTDANIDRAIKAICDDFIKVTQCTRQLSDLTITIATAAISVSAIANFRPELLLRAYIPAYGQLIRTDFDSLLAMQVEAPSHSALPTHIAFTTATAGSLYPIPDIAYTAKLLWLPRLTTFTAGTASPDGVALNIADDYLRMILTHGAPALLQHNEKEQRYASSSWKKYVEFRDSLIGAGSLGASVATRSFLEE